VDASFARVGPFFGQHFPELTLRGLHCASWLLDPQMAEVLLVESNIAACGSRWQLSDARRPGDADALFFVSSRRRISRALSDIDLADLPQQTSLQRAVVQRLRAGGHWHSRVGLLPLPDGVAHPGGGLTAARGQDPESLVRVFYDVYDVPVRTKPPSLDSDR